MLKLKSSSSSLSKLLKGRTTSSITSPIHTINNINNNNTTINNINNFKLINIQHYHINSIPHNSSNNNNNTFRESSTLLAKALLSRHQYYQQQQNNYNNNNTTNNTNANNATTINNLQQILIATTSTNHENKIFILYSLGGIIFVLTLLVLNHIYFNNSVMIGTNIKNVPTVEEVSFSFETLKKEISKQNDLSSNTIVEMKSLPDNQKIPFTLLLLSLNGIFMTLTLLVKNRMIGKLYINNPNQYIKYKKLQLNNQLLLNNLKNNTNLNNSNTNMDINNNLNGNGGNGGMPLSMVIQKQENQLLDDLTFTIKTNDKLFKGNEIEFKSKDITKIGIDNSITHLNINDKRFFIYCDHADSADELYQFLKQITKHNNIELSE